LIADGDMHLKNLAVLKTAEAGAKTFTAVRLAPLYAIDLTVGDAEAGLAILTARIIERLRTLQLPAFAGEFDGAKAVREKVEAIAAARCAALGTTRGTDRWG
jgi:serine/threonine-protein kinase HipA